MKLSILMPVYNEEDYIAEALKQTLAVDYPCEMELLVVDDGSRDATPDVLRRLMPVYPELRVLTHDRRCGKSAALRTGMRAASRDLVVTLDGDMQNDPRDIPRMIEAFECAGGTDRCGIVAGQRRKREDTWLRRFSSRIANGVRAGLLKDGTRDTGCGFKLLPRDVFLRLPFFEGLHRFLPALVRREGLEVALVDVDHRPRHAGEAKYGVWNRVWVGIVDMLMVWWLIHRCRLPGRVTSTGRGS